MLDFTSALYLGLRHASASLGPYSTLTLGQPAALREPPGAAEVAAGLARLQGFERATLLPSTLHLFWDLLQVLHRQTPSIALLDAGAYPVLRWAAAGARGSGCRVDSFAHHDTQALAEAVRRSVRAGRRPVVLADGFCPGCNRALPLQAFAGICAAHGGVLVIDDTQALGLLGHSASPACPYGKGGGGSLRWHGAAPEHITIGASLAKGLGAPLAVLAGQHELVERFERESSTRVHCSPPSVAAIRAARSALEITASRGAMLRTRLVRLVLGLRQRLVRRGLTAVGSLPFPVQSFLAGRAASVEELHRRLLARGIRTLLTRGCGALGVRLTFILTALHRQHEIDQVGEILADRLSIREQ